MFTLDERVERLERECRRWRQAGLATVAVGVLALIVGGDKPAEEPETIEAGRLVLRDKEGRTRIELVVDDEGVAKLAFSDQEGALRAGLAVGPKGGSELILKAAEDHPSISLGLLADDHLPYLHFTGKESTFPRWMLQLGAENSVHQSFCGKDGKERMGIHVTPEGRPLIYGRNEEGQDVFRSP